VSGVAVWIESQCDRWTHSDAERTCPAVSSHRHTILDKTAAPASRPPPPRRRPGRQLRLAARPPRGSDAPTPRKCKHAVDYYIWLGLNFFTKRHATRVIYRLTVQTLPDGLETLFTPPDTTETALSCLAGGRAVWIGHNIGGCRWSAVTAWLRCRERGAGWRASTVHRAPHASTTLCRSNFLSRKLAVLSARETTAVNRSRCTSNGQPRNKNTVKLEIMSNFPAPTLIKQQPANIGRLTIHIFSFPLQRLLVWKKYAPCFSPRDAMSQIGVLSKRVDGSSCFYRAMLCMRGTSHGPVSVCLSVGLPQVGVLLKWLGSSCFWHGCFFRPVLHCVIRKFEYIYKHTVLPSRTLSLTPDFRHGISIVKKWYQLSSRKADAQSVINWTVVGQLSWQYRRAPTIDCCSLSQWSSSSVYSTIQSRGFISDSWYLAQHPVQVNEITPTKLTKGNDCRVISWERHQ